MAVDASAPPELVTFTETGGGFVAVPTELPKKSCLGDRQSGRSLTSAPAARGKTNANSCEQDPGDTIHLRFFSMNAAHAALPAARAKHCSENARVVPQGVVTHLGSFEDSHLGQTRPGYWYSRGRVMVVSAARALGGSTSGFWGVP